ncbi:MAG: insulinase family protein [Myxococcales bacterium]|nr:insulinase family protein [Myxococcales bacterium]
MSTSTPHTRASVHEERLPSGLTVLARELHVAPVAEVQVWTRVGSADERADEAGLAHFHEHMLFKGTEQRGVGEVAGEIEGVGGRINAYTSFDVTVYHATLPAAELGTGIQVLADAVQNSIFDPEEVGREVEVVLEEIRRSEDSPHHVLSDALFEAAYSVHPYRAPILGTPESVSSFTSEKVSAFFRRWYTAENFVVVVTGDFDPRRAIDTIGEAFHDVRTGGATRARPSEEPRLAPTAALLRRPFERSCLEVCWPSVPFRHPDAPLLDLLAFVLGEGDSSRLYQRVKESERLSDRIDASDYTPFDAGLFGASADLDPAQIPQVLEAIGREVELLRHEPVSGAELEKARANFLAGEHWERESVSGIARKLGSFHVIAGDHAHEERYLGAIREASPDDLIRVAREWLVPERSVTAAVVPEDGPPGLDDSVMRDALESGVAAAKRRFRTPTSRPANEDVHSYELDNGIAVHVVPRRNVPIVSMRAAMLGGLLAETPATSGLGCFLASMWLRGTRSRSAADLAREIETLASDVDGFSGRSSAGLTVEATSEAFPAALDLFADVIREPAFAPEEIEKEREDTLASLERREDQLGARSFDLFQSTHFATHPYGMPIQGRAEAIRALTPEAVAAHHALLVDPRRMSIAVVGDVDADSAAAELSRRIGDLAPGATQPFSIPPEEPAPNEPREASIEKERAQAHLVIGFRGVTVRDPDRDVLDVISQLLSGQGGRLFLELRDKRSLAYTVSALNVEGVAPGFFAVYIATAPEKLDAARSGLFEELERLLQSAPDAAELDRAQRYLLGSHAIEQQRASARATHVALDALYGLGPADDRTYPDRIRAVTPEDILRVAQRIFTLDRPTIAAIV